MRWPLLLALCLTFGPGSVRALEEEAAGHSAVARIVGASPLHRSADLQRYVNQVGGVVASRQGTGRTWRFAVLESDSVNAFAVPGSIVLVTAGFLRLLGSEDELAAVLAHEIAHVTRLHHYQAIVRQRHSDGAAQRPNTSDEREGAEGAALALASATVYARGLARGAESEADRLGVQFMAVAGYDPSAYLGMLEKLDALGERDPRMVLLAATHPPARERIDDLVRAGIEKLPLPPPAAAQARASRFSRAMRAVQLP